MSPKSSAHHDADSKKQRRVADCGGSWEEIFLNEEEAGECASVSISVMLGHSILVLKNLATHDECTSLRHEATAFAESEQGKSLHSAEGRVRVPICEMLKAPGQALCDEILVRALTRTECSPSVFEPLTISLFGQRRVDSFLSEGIIHNTLLEFSEGEPAINIYNSKGSFKPHKDKESLTLLLNLSDQDAYEGGGTAFYSLADLKSSEYTLEPKVTVAVRPPSGVAVLFAGSVMHAGMRVVSGSRCVFVASFSPKRT